MHTSVARAWVAGMTALLLAAVVAAPAGAHSDLRSSDPADGAVLVQAPDAVSFIFNEELLAQGNAITLTAVATDERLALGPVEVEGAAVTVAWPERSPAGEYRAAYRVVSADGHPIDGAITFTVEQALGDPDPSPEPAASSTPSAVPASQSPEPVAASGDDVDGQAGAGALTWILGLGLVILVGAGAGTWVTRRSR